MTSRWSGVFVCIRCHGQYFKLYTKIGSEWTNDWNYFYSNTDRYGSVIRREKKTEWLYTFWRSLGFSFLSVRLKVYRGVEQEDNRQIECVESKRFSSHDWRWAALDLDRQKWRINFKIEIEQYRFSRAKQSVTMTPRQLRNFSNRMTVAK